MACLYAEHNVYDDSGGDKDEEKTVTTDDKGQMEIGSMWSEGVSR